MNPNRKKIFGKRDGNRWVVNVGGDTVVTHTFDTLMEARAAMRKIARQKYEETKDDNGNNYRWSWGTSAKLVTDGEQYGPLALIDSPIILIAAMVTDDGKYREEWKIRLPKQWGEGRYFAYTRIPSTTGFYHHIIVNIGNTTNRRFTEVSHSGDTKSKCMAAARAGRIKHVPHLLNPVNPLQLLKCGQFNQPFSPDDWDMITKNAVIVDNLPDDCVKQYNDLNKYGYLDSHDADTRALLHRMNTRATISNIIPPYIVQLPSNRFYDDACATVDATLVHTGTVVLDYSNIDQIIRLNDQEDIVSLLKYIIDNKIPWALSGLKFYLENEEHAVLWKVVKS